MQALVGARPARHGCQSRVYSPRISSAMSPASTLATSTSRRYSGTRDSPARAAVTGAVRGGTRSAIVAASRILSADMATRTSPSCAFAFVTVAPPRSCPRLCGAGTRRSARCSWSCIVPRARASMRRSAGPPTMTPTARSRLPNGPSGAGDDSSPRGYLESLLAGLLSRGSHSSPRGSPTRARSQRIRTSRSAHPSAAPSSTP